MYNTVYVCVEVGVAVKQRGLRLLNQGNAPGSIN